MYVLSTVQVDIPVAVVSAVAETEGGDPELTATKLLFLQEQVRERLLWDLTPKSSMKISSC